MKLKTIVPWVAVSLAACSSAYPPRDTSTLDRINQQLKQAAVPVEKAAEPSLPEAVSNLLLPPLKSSMPKISAKQLEQRFDLVVKDAPVNQVLMSIVSDTPYSIMLKPKGSVPKPPAAAGAAAAPETAELPDKMTVNLKNVTVFEALDAIREVYGYDYTVDGNRIYVQQPELETRLYQVNYVIGQRRGVSDLQVIGGASVGSSSNSGTTGTTSSTSSTSGTTSSYSSVQASGLSTTSNSDIWREIEDTLRTTLGCQIPNEKPRTGGMGAVGMTPSTTSSTSSSGTASRADVSFVGEMQSGERERGVNGCSDGRSMTINPMSGTILVRGMPNELRMIEKMLHSMQVNIERQVIIEAKIIDVELNSGAQQGINWATFNNYNQSRFSVGSTTTAINAITGSTTTLGGTVAAGTSLGQLLGGSGAAATTAATSSGLGLAVQFSNFAALINFLQTQGQVHVLSNPRIATLSNQKAVLKVGSEEPFVSNASGGGVVQGSGGTPSTVTNPTITYQPFFSGIALDVTPQIDDKGNITLHVHSMVNKITEKDKIAIIQTGGNISLPFAVNTISETDNVVKTQDGQVIVIGGLMTESAEDDRSKVPGAGDVPGVGALFSNGAQSKTKRELVILLKPTVVKDDSAWANDIAGVQGRIEGFGTGTSQPKP